MEPVIPARALSARSRIDPGTMGGRGRSPQLSSRFSVIAPGGGAAIFSEIRSVSLGTGTALGQLIQTTIRITAPAPAQAAAFFILRIEF